MSRKNDKEQLVTHENTIKKSNKLSMAEMNKGLTLNQMQLLAYAIFSTQQNGETEFRKYEFQDKFGINNYKTGDAYEDGQSLSILQFRTKDLENNKFSFTNVFSSIEYETGHFIFEWNNKMIPHIIELKEKYVLTDLTMTSHFKSGFSWTLYDYMKGHYGNWYKKISKDESMILFNVEDRKSYQRSTAEFKRSVLDIAIMEINKHTELEVWYTENKVGNKITDFILYWSTGKQQQGATDKQVQLLREIHDEVDKSLLDYLQIISSDLEKQHIIRIKTIHEHVNKGLSISEADKYIKESLQIYKKLEQLVEQNGKQRDTSIYYNWLEEIDH